MTDQHLYFRDKKFLLKTDFPEQRMIRIPDGLLDGLLDELLDGFQNDPILRHKKRT